MSELKTRPTGEKVSAFIRTIPDEELRRDAATLLAMMSRVTRAKPRMWGSSIVGFGSCHYVYASGREGDWFPLGFSPRKKNLTLYLMSGLGELTPLMKDLGKFKTGGGCLYVRRLSDVNLPALRTLMRASLRVLKSRSR
jgi:hypothetical protein